jgi:hypothetical protein
MADDDSIMEKAEKKIGLSYWLAENWRSLAFVIYGAICIFDFIIMPAIYQTFNQHLDANAVVNLALQFKDTQAQIAFLHAFGEKISWNPITLQGGGTFHIAFGSLLTAAGWTRGQEKIAAINNQWPRPAVSAPPVAPTPPPVPTPPQGQ